MTDSQRYVRPSLWPHRLVVVLALVTFPLIWVGGLVTTYDAGMAVPDWPGTYGYNLLLYPWQSWLAAPFDLFIEHGHRLLGAAAGLLAIGLVISVLLVDRRPWLVAAAVGALGLVIVQGVLGGARVLFDERLVALVHACMGPIFFAYLGALAVATSRWWSAVQFADSAAGRRFMLGAWSAAGLAYFQLFLGAVLRHIPSGAAPTLFRAALLLHLLLAAGLVVHVFAVLWRGQKLPSGTSGVMLLSVLLAMLVVGQLALGAATYVAKYAFPAWLGDFTFAAGYVVQEKSLTQSLITTAHVANGSLILLTAVVLASRATRLFFAGQAASLPALTDRSGKLAAGYYAGRAA